MDKPAPAYWNGDEIDIAVIGGDGYMPKSVRRVSKLQRFIGPGALSVAIVKGCVSSFPRCMYMRKLEKKPWKHGIVSDSSDLAIYLN